LKSAKHLNCHLVSVFFESYLLSVASRPNNAKKNRVDRFDADP
jgi:hypothetical protein